MKEYSRQLIVGALARSDGDRAKAAKLLGLSRSQLYRLVKMHGLDDQSSDNGKEGTNWFQ